jgi:hypothetical protein
VSVAAAARSGELAGLACAVSLEDDARVRQRLESLKTG